MPVIEQYPITSANGNGVTTVFPYQFQIAKKQDIKVTVAGVTKALDVDYTVSNVGAQAGGDITFLTGAPANGALVRFIRDMKLDRSTDYQENGDLLAATLDADQDREWLALQQLAAYLGIGPSAVARALLLGESDIDGNGAYDARSNRIKNLDDPIDNQDAATKLWSLNTIAASITDGAGNAVLQLLASYDSNKGSSLVGFLQAGAGAIGRTVQAKLRDLVSVKDFGALGDGVANDSAAIQAAHNALPSSGGLLYFPPGNYVFSGITITKPLRILCAGGFDGAVTFTNPSATAPTFSANGVNAFIATGFKATSSVTRTAGKYFDLINCNRVSITDFFMDKYYIGIGIDGGSEIKIDTFQMFDGVSGAASPNSGAILLGDNNYTGSIGIDNGYIKCQNVAAQCSFGIRTKYVDVLTIGANVTIISHGTDFDVVPGNGQTASLIRSWGAIYDTANIGVRLAPTGTGRVIRSDFYGGWYGQHSVTGVVVDGTSGTVDGVTFFGGEAMNNASVGINVFGANAKNIKVADVDVGGNPTGIRAATNADVRIEENTIGAVGAAAANNIGLAIDNTVTGVITRNKFAGNTTNQSGAPGSGLQVFDNIGIDSNWLSFTPTITSETGTLTTTSATGRYRVSYQTVHFEMTITITTNGTGATSILATLPVSPRVGFEGAGRAIGISGKMLQAFAGGAATTVRIANYDGTYPAADGEIMLISGTYEIS